MLVFEICKENNGICTNASLFHWGMYCKCKRQRHQQVFSWTRFKWTNHLCVKLTFGIFGVCFILETTPYLRCIVTENNKIFSNMSQ